MDKIDNIGLTRMLTQSYDFDGFTPQEVWSRIAQRMNIIIEHFNYLERTVKDKQELIDKKLDYLLNEDLTIEIAKVVIEKIEDGTLASLINDKLLKDVNTKVDTFKIEVSEQLDTIRNKMVYATNFGVKADGITDDTEALQNAIDYLKPKDISNLWTYQNCGGTVILPKGLIKISKTIRLYSNVKIIGTNKSLFGRATDDTTILLDTNDKTISAFSFVGIEPNTNTHSNKLFITGEEMDNGTVTQTWNVTLEGFTLKSKNGNDLAINLSGGVESKINDVSFNNFDIDIFASANWDNEINNCNTICNFAHMVLVGGNTLLVNSPYINSSENIKSSLNKTHIMHPYVNNENLVYKNTPSGIINTGLYGLNIEKPIIEKIKIGVQICMSELGVEKYYNNCSINKIHMEHIEKAFVFKNIACLINGVFAYIPPGTSEYLIEGYSSHITGINVQPIKHIKLYKEDINGSYNFFGSVNEWITRTELSGATIGKTSFESWENEAIVKTWQQLFKTVVGEQTVEKQYTDLKQVMCCQINSSKLVITSPPDSPVDVRYANTVILNSSSAKTIYSFKARDFQEFTVIALKNNISLNGNESGGLMIIKDGVVDPIPVGGVMKFICYNGVCYEISRSF